MSNLSTDPENGHFHTDEGLFDSTCAPSSSSAEAAEGVEVVLAAATHSILDVAEAAVKVVEAGGQLQWYVKDLRRRRWRVPDGGGCGSWGDNFDGT